MTYLLSLSITLCGLAMACSGPSASSPESDASSEPQGDGGPARSDAGGSAPTAGPLCSPDGFCWLNPQPVGFDLHDVWGPNADDLWAAGADGSLLHWDGTEWSWHPLGITDEALDAIWGFSTDDIWVVGRNGFMGHYDGSRWTRSEAPARRDLRDVWGSAPNDVWAVGDAGLLIHYDGREWSRVDAGTDQHLKAVQGRGADVYVLAERALLQQIDGRFIRVYGSEAGDDEGGELHFTAMHVNASSVVLAAESYGLHRWDGESLLRLQDLNTASRWYRTVWSHGDEVWAAGFAEGVHIDADGSATRAVLPAHQRIHGLHGWDADGPVGVGQWGAVYHWDSARKTFETGARLDPWPIGSLYAPNAREAWAPARGANVLHCLDAQCDVEPLGGDGEDSPLHAVWGSAAEDVWAVSVDGTVYRFDGTLWGRPLPGPEIDGQPLDIGGSAGDDVWIVGEEGMVWRFDGATWAEVPSGTESDLRAVWAWSANDVWIVGGRDSNDIILHYDGERLSTVAEGMFGARLFSVTGSGSNDVWVGGHGRDTSLLAHFDGREWTRRRLPRPSNAVFDLASSGPGEVWVATGMLWRVDANGATGAAGALGGLAAVALGGTSVWAAGANGTVLRADTALLQ